MKTQPLPKELTISPDVIFQELGSGTVLLDLDNELYYALDEVGMRLWQLLAENGDPAAAMARLSAEYDVDETTLREDINGVVNELQEAKLVTVTH